jgi:hypothetical protein
VIEWSADSKKALVVQKNGDVSRMLFIDTRAPEKSIDLTARFPDFQLAGSRFAASSGDVLYVLQAGVLRRFTISNSEVVTVANGVEAYAGLNEKTIAFVRKNEKNSQFELVIRSDDKQAVIHRSYVAKGSHRLTLSEYEGAVFVTAAMAGEKSVRVYKNPLSEPILDEQLPYTILKNNVESITKSPNGQFILTQSGTKVVVHDFEYARNYSFEVSAASPLVWVSNHHLIFESADKKSFVMEFDGANRYEIPSSVRSLPSFSDGMSSLYYITQEKNSLSLQYADITKP